LRHLLLKRRHGPLGTDSGHDPYRYSYDNGEEDNRTEIAGKIISSVKSEMRKPRLTESVRNDERGQVAPVVEKRSSRSQKI